MDDLLYSTRVATTTAKNIRKFELTHNITPSLQEDSDGSFNIDWLR